MSTAAAIDARGWKAYLTLITGKVALAPGISYAFGFVDGNGSVGHGGGAPGMNGDLRIYPKSAYVVVVLANFDPPAAQRIYRLPRPAASDRVVARHLATRSTRGVAPARAGCFATGSKG